jgi:hypothetical protein
MAEGVPPVGVVPPLAVNNPVVRSMLKDETDESPSAATKSAPVPEVLLEVLLEQAVKQNNNAGSATPARNRNLVPILFLLPVLPRAFRRSSNPLHRQIEVQKYPHLCTRNNREEQTTLAGWNHDGGRKLPHRFLCKILKLSGRKWFQPDQGFFLKLPDSAAQNRGPEEAESRPADRPLDGYWP